MAVGDFGTILLTSDHGQSWRPVHATSVRLRDVWGTPEGLLIAVGDEGLVLRSTDRGESFVAVHADPGKQLRRVAGNAAGVVVAVGPDGAWRSSNWGQSWIPVVELPAGLSDVAVDSVSGSIWVAGMDDAEQSDPLLMRSDDGGVNWRADSGGHWINRVAATGGWVFASGAGELLRRTPQGKWQKSAGFPLHGDLITSDDGRLWMVGGDPVMSADRGQTWQVCSVGSRVRLRDLARSPSGEVYAVGDAGTVWVSSDDGQSWQHTAGGYVGDYFTLVVTPDHLAAVGDSVLLIDRQDRSRQRVPWVTGDLTSLWGHADHWYAAGQSGRMLSSTDRGVTWSELPALATSVFHRGVAFENGDAYVAGRGGVQVLRDHGQRRVSALQDRRVWLHAVWGAAPDDVWAVGDRAVVWHSADRGASWQPVSLNTDVNLTAVWGRGKELVIATQWGSLFRSVDGGRTFDPRDLVKTKATGTREPIEIYDLWAGARGPWFVATRRGLFRSVGERWQRVKGLPDELTAVVGDGRYVWVATPSGDVFRGTAYGTGFRKRGHLPARVRSLYASSGTLVASGAHGLLARSTDGGKTWAPRLISNHSNVRYPATAAFLARGRLWMAASRGNLLSSGDGGRNWELHRVPPTADAVSTQWASGCGTDDAIYYSDDAPFVSRSTDGGKSFEPHAIGTGVSLRALACDGKRVFGVGRDGSFVRSDDAGVTWKLVATGSSQTLFALAVQGDELWAVGSTGTILRSQNAGESWQPAPSGTERNLYSILRLASGAVVAVGEKGTVLTSADGSTWTEEPPVVAYDLWSVVGDGDGRVYAAGYGGAVLERVTPVQ